MPFLNFINQIFLIGLAAAILPILIHLFSRRRTREVRFPSLEFLQEVSRKKVRRIQLRQILLLVLRVLIIAFFALAMGRPAVRTDLGGLGKGSSTVAIVIDNSMSMAVRDPGSTGLPSEGSEITSSSPVPEEGTVFEAAKLRALEILSLMGEGDRGLLVLAAAPVTLPLPTPVADASLLRQEVERASLEPTPAELPQAVERAAAALASSRTLTRELYIISDFQREDVEAWKALAKQSGDSASLSIPGLGSLPEETRVYLIPVRTLPVDNLAIERVRLESYGGAETSARLTCSIANFAPKEARDVVVRVLAEGEQGEAIGEGFANVPAMGRSDASILLRRTPGSAGLRVVLAPDPLSWDNTAYLVPEQPGVRRILVITGSPDPESDSAARYLRLALDPTGNQEFFAVEVVPADLLSLTVRSSADMIILLDVARLPAPALEQIERFRAEGGGVLVFLGGRADPRTYNTSLFPRLASVELLEPLGDPLRPDVYRSLRVSAAGHPIFEGFPAGAGQNLTGARFHRLMGSSVGPEARVLAEFSGGVPALIEDRGTLVFTSGLEDSWSDLATSGAFLPLLHRIAGYLLARGGSQGSLRPTETIEVSIDADRLENQSATFIDPQGARTPAQRSEREGKVLLRSDPVRLPGIYSLVRDDGASLGAFAVNVDSRESDLRLAPESWLPGLFSPEATVLRADGEIHRSLVEARQGRELWPILLMIVLGLMVAESLLGRGKLLP